jgi:hypothetical protein
VGEHIAGQVEPEHGHVYRYHRPHFHPAHFYL